METCPKCGSDKAVHSNGWPGWHPLHESYPNFYGAICGNCGCFVKSDKLPPFMEEKGLKLKLLEEKVREKLRESLRRKK